MSRTGDRLNVRVAQKRCVLTLLAIVGLCGTVPRTTSGPEDPSWNLRPDDLRRVNDLFRLGEQKKSAGAR